ncbi:MAG: OsmC family protein [Spirochaetota bacterium]
MTKRIEFANRDDVRLAARMEPPADGTPIGYALLAALGACTAMTLRMYADRKEWPLESVTVPLSHEKIHAKDSDSCDDETAGRKTKIDRIERVLEIEGELDDEQREKLLEIANKCPVQGRFRPPRR